MPSLASISDPKVYHILTYSTLFGSNLWNTFFAGPIAYKCLPRPQFATLQTNIFPAFFSLHTALPLVLAFTYPGLRLVNRPGAEIVQTNAGWRGLLAEQSFWSSLVPIAAMFGTSLLNLVILGPATTSVMKKRKHQGTTSVFPCLIRFGRNNADQLHRNKRWKALLRSGSQIRGHATTK